MCDPLIIDINELVRKIKEPLDETIKEQRSNTVTYCFTTDEAILIHHVLVTYRDFLNGLCLEKEGEK